MINRLIRNQIRHIFSSAGKVLVIFALILSASSIGLAEEYELAPGEEFWDGNEEVFDIELSPEEGSGDVISARTGVYPEPSGWSVDLSDTTENCTIYKLDECLGMANTSTIKCSYMDTNYSVYEYEQLRDMLTNNLVYSNANAQISTSAVYTDSKDYLYIVLVDDSSQEYRDVYYYVVGDYRCFTVEVREYRAEVESFQAQELSIPQEVAKEMAEKFVWQ